MPRKTTTPAETTVDTHTEASVLELLKQGKPLPPGWCFDARRKPRVFRREELDGPAPPAETGDAPD